MDVRYPRVDRDGPRCVRRDVWRNTLIALSPRHKLSPSFALHNFFFGSEVAQRWNWPLKLIGQQIVYKVLWDSDATARPYTTMDL